MGTSINAYAAVMSGGAPRRRKDGSLHAIQARTVVLDPCAETPVRVRGFECGQCGHPIRLTRPGMPPCDALTGEPHDCTVAAYELARSLYPAAFEGCPEGVDVDDWDPMLPASVFSPVTVHPDSFDERASTADLRNMVNGDGSSALAAPMPRPAPVRPVARLRVLPASSAPPATVRPLGTPARAPTCTGVTWMAPTLSYRCNLPDGHRGPCGLGQRID